MDSKLVIVPDLLAEAINIKLDTAFKEFPDAEVDRDTFYQWLLDYFDEHGYVPDFKLERKTDGH